MPSCRGKTVLVTNASRAPGEAAAMALADAGALVLVHDDRSMAKVEAIAEKIRSAGGVAKAITANISIAQGPRQLAQRTREIIGDRLDILIFNPGISMAQQVNDAPVEIFAAQFAASERAPFFLVQQLLPILTGGSSVIFTCTHPSLTKHFAALLEPRGIRVNAIDVQRASSQRRGGSNKHRAVVAESVREAIAFLVSNQANQITGETLQVHVSRMHRPRRTAAVSPSRS